MERIISLFKLKSVIFYQISAMPLLLVIVLINLIIFILWNYKEKIIKKSDDFIKSLKAGKIAFIISNVSVFIFSIFLTYKLKNILEETSNIFFIILSNLIIFVLWNYKEKIIKKSDDFIKSLEGGKIVFTLSNLSILGFAIFLANKFKNVLEDLSTTYIKEDWVSIIIGVTALIIPIVIQIWSESDKLKKVILNTIFNINNYMYISLIILFAAFFKVLPIFLIGFFIYIICSLYQILKVQNKVKKILYYPDEFQDIINILGKINNKKEILIFYKELEKLLFNNIKNKEMDFLNSYIIVWRKTFEFTYKYMELEEKDEVIIFIYDIYKLFNTLKNETIFIKCSYLHINVACVALQNKEMGIFRNSLCSMSLLYEYYIKNEKKEELKQYVVDGMRYNICIQNIIKEFKENLEVGIKWCGCFYISINNCIIQTIKNKDEDFFCEFLKLINSSSIFEENNPKEYILLRYSNYFGLLLMIKILYEKKIEESFIDRLKKKILEEICKISYEELDRGIEGIGDVYLFIKKYKVDELLKWEEYFVPKLDIIYPTFYSSNKSEKIDELFLELLYFEKDILKIPRQEDIFIKKMIDKSNKNLISIYRFLELIKKVDIDDKKEFLKNLFEKIMKIIEELEKEEIRKQNVSLKKVNEIMEKIKLGLEDVEINKIFPLVIKYKEIDSKENISVVGVNIFYDKREFIEIDDIIIGEDPFRKMVKAIEKRLKSSIIEKILKKSEKNKIDSLENINKENSIVIVSGIGKSKFLRENEHIKNKRVFNENEKEKYGDYVEELYNGMPIYFFPGEIKGTFILEEKFIQEIKFFKKENDEIFTEEEIKKYIDIGDIGLQLEIESFEKFYEEKTEKRKEELLELDFLKEFNEKEEKLKHLKEQVLFKLYQEYEIVINEEKKVYQLIFKENDII